MASIAEISPGIFYRYWKWHYFDQPKILLKAWRNFLVFGINFFSIPLLLKTFFSPWHRYYVSYGRGFDFKVWAEAIFSNLIFRVLGAIVRVVVIVLGLLFEIFVFLAGLIIFLGWLVLPFALFFGFVFALKLLVY